MFETRCLPQAANPLVWAARGLTNLLYKVLNG